MAQTTANAKNNVEELVDKAKDKVQETSDTVREACLLYTSPSPRDLSTSRMPSSA